MASLLLLLLFSCSFQVVLSEEKKCCDPRSSCPGDKLNYVKPAKKDPCECNVTCTNQCQIGCYLDDDKTCQKCHTPCSSCHKHKCLSCVDPYYITKAGICTKSCGPKNLMINSSSPRVRLTQGRTVLEGVIEVYYNGLWGTICADGWGNLASSIVCKELKLGTAVETKIVGQYRFEKKSAYKETNIWLSDVTCTGKENSIFECKHSGWGQNQCSHLEDVGIRCSGPNMTRACVSSCPDGYFASKSKCIKCPLDCKTCTSFNNCSSCVETRYLQGGSCVARCKQGYYGELKKRKCELCPSECATCVERDGSIECTSCSPNKLVNFLNGDNCVANCPRGVGYTKYLRLSGDHESPYMGLLEVKYNGQWHTVCDDGFYLNAARVFCRELGYGQPVKYGGGLYGYGEGKILTMNMDCNGNEQSFLDCDQKKWFSPGCSHHEDVGLWCKSPSSGYAVKDKCIEKCPEGTFPNKQKLCELCHRNCSTCSRHPENCDKCRKGFFHNGTTCIEQCPFGTYADSSNGICLPCNAKCLTCKEQPDNCQSCVSPYLHNGTHCVNKCPDNMYRKEYFCVWDCGLRHYPKNGVCMACQVNCLACTSDKNCTACEREFALTNHSNCSRSCPSDQYRTHVDPKSLGINLPLRLSSIEKFTYKGRLEIKHNGVWGSICDDRWEGENAVVACKQLLLGPPVKSLYLRAESYKELNISRIWLDDVECKGTEDKLSNCKFKGWGIENCFHSEDVHIECQRPGISRCDSECLPPYFVNGTNCLPCSFPCTNCSGNASNCTSCEQGYFLMGTACVKECPLGYFKTNNQKCDSCHSDCLTCSGPGEARCSSCKPPNKLFKKVTCIAKCPPDYYERGVNPYIKLFKKVGPYEGVVMITTKGKTGFVCNRFLRIEDGHVVCRQLNMGKALEVYESEMYRYPSYPLLLENRVCFGNESSIMDCPSREIKFYCSRRNIMSVKCSGPDLSSMCVKKCPPKENLFVRNNTVCDFCSSDCLGCKKNSTSCIDCPKGRLLTWDKKCVEYCHEGTFYHYKTKRCEKCDEICIACHTSKESCTVCSNGKYLFAGVACRKECAPNYYARIGSNDLRLIPDPYLSSLTEKNGTRGLVEIFMNNQWLPVCGANFHIQDAAIVCHQLGYGDPVDIFSRGRRLELGYMEELPQFNCTGTEKTVSECSTVGPCRYSVHAGVTCSRSTPKRECVKPCGDGYYLSQDKINCLPCSPNCTTCSGSATTCTSCSNERGLHGSKCLLECPDGYFMHLKSMTCERCSDMCRTCHNGFSNERCASCKKPYFLRGMSCVGTCYPDHSLEDLRIGTNTIELTKNTRNIWIANGSSINEGLIYLQYNGQPVILCYASQFIANLACLEMGFQGGKSQEYDRSYAFNRYQKVGLTCLGYEKSLSDCKITPIPWCRRIPILTCSRKPLDTRVCRKENHVPCDFKVCDRNVPCINGDGKVIPKGHSYCLNCLINYFGDGQNCTAIAKVVPSVRVKRFDRHLYLRSTYYPPCFGRAGRVYVIPNRHSWFKDGKPWDILGGRLTLGPLTYHDTGVYECFLRTSLGSVTITFNITVKGPPIIIRADNVDIIKNQQAMLNCEVMANPPAEIFWSFGNVTFNENGTRDGGGPRVIANNSLWIPQPIRNDSGNYTCEARNTFGNTLQRVLFRIGEGLHFERKASLPIVSKGERAEFTCKPLSTGRSMSIKWRRNGRTLKSGDKYSVDDGKLTIKSVSSEDCGIYYCVARDGVSIVTSVGTLAIKDEPPCIHTPPQNLNLKSGMYARFYCAASGYPAAKISWQNSKEHNNTFEIKKVSVSNVGLYTCTARSGEKISKAYAFLSVDGHHSCPLIFRKPTDKVATFGDQVTFNCDGVAPSPEVSFSWRKGNSIITHNRKYKLSNGNKKLDIMNVNRDDIGEYWCTISGQYGKSSVSASLTSVNVGASTGRSSPNTAGIVIGVIVCILVILIVLYFVYRYRRRGHTPGNVFNNVKFKFQSTTKHVELHEDLNQDSDDSENYDTSDTNPFVRE